MQHKFLDFSRDFLKSIINKFYIDFTSENPPMEPSFSEEKMVAFGEACYRCFHEQYFWKKRYLSARLFTADILEIANQEIEGSFQENYFPDTNDNEKEALYFSAFLGNFIDCLDKHLSSEKLYQEYHSIYYKSLIEGELQSDK